MAVLVDKHVNIARTVAISADEARAYSSDMRRRIVKMLYGRAMTGGEIVKTLLEGGHAKSYPAVRQHIRQLYEAGIVDIAAINTVRGTVEKHYTTTVRMLEYSAPEGFEKAYSSEIRAAERRIEAMLVRMAPAVANRIPAGANDPDYEQFILAEIINRAMTRVFESRGGAKKAGGGARKAKAAAAGPKP